jgi:Family of unknown function (DUF5946)
MDTDQDAYNELCYYTIPHGDPAFIHQHVVDAYAAQTCDETDKPIKLTFALAGLYLYVEKQFTGRHSRQARSQLAHMQLVHKKQPWAVFALPAERGEITVREVLAAAAGPARDEVIQHWRESIWKAFSESRTIVSELLSQHGII